MLWQGESAPALRVRRQGLRRDDASPLPRRPVHRPAKALPGNPYDGHTLGVVLPEIEAQIGASLERIVADRGYRGHNAPPEYRFGVYISGQKRRVTERIKRDLRRRSAVEPRLGHLKSEHCLGRNHLAHAAGYNFRRLLAWLAILLRVWLAAVIAVAKAPLDQSALAESAFFTDDGLTHGFSRTSQRS
jgi:hypothetical protein